MAGAYLGLISLDRQDRHLVPLPKLNKHGITAKRHRPLSRSCDVMRHSRESGLFIFIALRKGVFMGGKRRGNRLQWNCTLNRVRRDMNDEKFYPIALPKCLEKNTLAIDAGFSKALKVGDTVELRRIAQ